MIMTCAPLNIIIIIIIYYYRNMCTYIVQFSNIYILIIL